MVGKIGQGSLKYKDRIFGSIFLYDETPLEKKIWIFRRKVQIWMFMDLIGFLIEFIEDLIARKIDF